MLSEERKGEIAVAMGKIHFRDGFRFRDIQEVRRKVGNLIQDPEMVKAKVQKRELVEFAQGILYDLYCESMEELSSVKNSYMEFRDLS